MSTPFVTELRKGEGPTLIPYGAALALACAVILIGARL